MCQKRQMTPLGCRPARKITHSGAIQTGKKERFSSRDCIRLRRIIRRSHFVRYVRLVRLSDPGWGAGNIARIGHPWGLISIGTTPRMTHTLICGQRLTVIIEGGLLQRQRVVACVLPRKLLLSMSRNPTECHYALLISQLWLRRIVISWKNLQLKRSIRDNARGDFFWGRSGSSEFTHCGKKTTVFWNGMLELSRQDVLQLSAM